MVKKAKEPSAREAAGGVLIESFSTSFKDLGQKRAKPIKSSAERSVAIQKL